MYPLWRRWLEPLQELFRVGVVEYGLASIMVDDLRRSSHLWPTLFDSLNGATASHMMEMIADTAHVGVQVG